MKTPFIRISALLLASALLFALSVLALSGQVDSILPSILTENEPSVNPPSRSFTVILDPGHGGEDGGAVGIGGVCEKGLNLEVALKTKAFLEFFGAEVCLTRSDDRMLGPGTAGMKKLEDLRARLNYANEHPQALLVSIHMNKFPLSYCKGIQIYYSGNREESAELAQTIGNAVKQFQPDNKREIKKADGAIYLLDRVLIPSVLIECGFLSNPEEAALLQSEEYQARIALLLAASICGYHYQQKAETPI